MRLRMTTAAQGDQVVGLIGAAPGAGDLVVDLKKVRALTPRALTAMAVARQDLATSFWLDGGPVSVAGPTDHGITGKLLLLRVR
jgi:hypothetical protein